MATVCIYLAGAGAIYAFLDRETLQKALSLPISIVAALLGLSLANYAVRAWRWVMLGNYLSFRVPVATNILYYLAGYCLTSTPGKAGEAVRLWLLKTGHGIPYVRSLPIMLADRIIDMWAVLILSLLSIAGFTQYKWEGFLLALVIVIISIPILFPRFFEPALYTIFKLAPKRRRWIVRGRRLMRAMADLSSWRTYGLTLAPTIIGWLAECAALFLLLQHFEANVTFINAIFIFSFSIVVGAISMLPGGLGSTEATIVILLRALGVDLGTALAVTAIIRITTFWFAVAIGLLLMPVAMDAAARSASILSSQNSGNN